MLQIILILLGLATNGSDAGTQNTDQDQTATTQTDGSTEIDTGGETAQLPKK